jgi:heme/copper-type cytochrome/quinol oxidase subunit 3
MAAAISAHGHAAEHGIDNDRKVKIGMGFYVLVDVIFVVFLLISYIWLRAYNTADGWFPKGTKVPDATTSYILTALIVASALCYFVAYRGIRSGNQVVLRAGLLAATLLLVAGLVGQVWFQGHLPFVTDQGSFASAYIMLSSYHIYHLALGTFMGLGITHRAFRGRYAPDRMLGVVTVGYYWYWMAATPVLIALLMLALPPQV